MEGSGMMAEKFDAVLFDMDGVLVDSEELIARSAMMMFRRRYAVEVARNAFYPYVGAGEDRFIGGPASDMGFPIDIQAAKAWTYEIYDELASDYIKVLPGAPEYLHACRETGLKIALASAADLVKVRINLRILGVGIDFFDAVVTGSDIERKKPFPDIYLLAASRVGVDIGRCLVVEDAVNGILAGVSAGATCLGLTTSFSEETLRKAGARWCAPHLGAVGLPFQLD
ncbi:MAG TPA: HAD-IA family hydrolase [Rectinemataceae bacterium]|nr:HAD-IA family hydrolase [Rectinemataceae bacterium]